MRLTGKQVQEDGPTRVGRVGVGGWGRGGRRRGDAKGAGRKRKRKGQGKDEEERGPIHDCALVNGLNGRSREREREREKTTNLNHRQFPEQFGLTKSFWNLPIVIASVFRFLRLSPRLQQQSNNRSILVLESSVLTVAWIYFGVCLRWMIIAHSKILESPQKCRTVDTYGTASITGDNRWTYYRAIIYV